MMEGIYKGYTSDTGRIQVGYVSDTQVVFVQSESFDETFIVFANMVAILKLIQVLLKVAKFESQLLHIISYSPA
jgi:hypothetical protein